MAEESPPENDDNLTPDEPESFMDRHDPNELRRGLKYVAAATGIAGAFIGGKVALSNARNFSETIPEQAKQAAVAEMAEAVQHRTPARDEFIAEFQDREKAAKKRIEDSHDGEFEHTVKGSAAGAAIGAAVPPVGFAGMIVHSAVGTALGGFAERRRRKQAEARQAKGEPGLE